MKPLSNYLQDSVNRAKIGRQLEASGIIDTCNAFLKELLEDQYRLARACSYKFGTLNIDCTSSVIANEIVSHETQLRNYMHRAIPEMNLKHVRTRIKTEADLWYDDDGVLTV